ncbi:molybdate transport system substrate-binding protein [Polynucleobacter kasalickyi]|uniref:Molybdate transport system substrate-binding protein n=1 Tax=Polynucleobacter kasalickyi TaxID=1938817 RepID=A0A1W1ZIS0_9BURK|nr:molybdate transport system substrate-binding protein [Polynucleobacter kasalickyi]
MYLILKSTSLEKLSLVLIVFLLGFFASPRLPVAQVRTSAPIILAAANVRLPLEEIAVHFERLSKIKPKIIYGSSGNFYQQILNGGKFDLFLSADEHFIDLLQEKKVVQLGSVVYAKGRLVIWVSKRAFSEPVKLEAIQNTLLSSKVMRIAIANPNLAPYGKATEQVLRKWGIWQDVQKKIIMGENVGQVAQFALSGSVEIAFLPVSYTMQAEMQKNAYVLPIPDDLYAPLMQKMALLSKQSEANDFYQFILDQQNKKIWEKYGYTVP